MRAEEIYESSIRQLPASDRLRLASIILDGLTASKGPGRGASSDTSDEDISGAFDLTAIHRSLEDIRAGRVQDARDAMRQIAAEAGIRLNR